MANFESPIGSKKINRPAMREFTVPDESGFQYPENMVELDNKGIADLNARLNNSYQQIPDENLDRQFAEMRAAKQAKLQGRERISEGGRRRIDLLLGMRRETRKFECEGQYYILQSLKPNELREIALACVPYDGTVELGFEMRKQVLARSIIEIDGVNLNDFLGSSDLESKLSLMDEFDEAFITRLYSEFMILKARVQDKYLVKNDVEAKEVVEDLKK
jgi:hypothetical protein